MFTIYHTKIASFFALFKTHAITLYMKLDYQASKHTHIHIHIHIKDINMLMFKLMQSYAILNDFFSRTVSVRAFKIQANFPQQFYLVCSFLSKTFVLINLPAFFGWAWLNWSNTKKAVPIIIELNALGSTRVFFSVSFFMSARCLKLR